MERTNLLDIAKTTDPKGKAATVIEVLNQHNAIVEDAPAYEANAITGNRVTLRSSLPVVDFTKINKGSVRSKGSYRQVTDSMGILDGLSEVDSRQRILVGDELFQAHRWREDKGFLESMAQTAALNLVYGDENLNEAAFTGLQPRLETLNDEAGANAIVRDAGGQGADNTSIYVVDWSEDTAHLIYSPGAAAGVAVKPLGEQRVTDKDNNPFPAFCTSYVWVIGLTVKDQRHIGRVANIDSSDLDLAGTAAYAGPDLVTELTWLIESMPQPAGATRVIYVHPKVYAAYQLIAQNGKNVNLSLQEYMGRKVPHYDVYPIRKVDRISLAEARVV